MKHLKAYKVYENKNITDDWYVKIPHNDPKHFEKHGRKHFDKEEIEKIAELSMEYNLCYKILSPSLLLVDNCFDSLSKYYIKIEVVKFGDEWYRALINGSNIFEWYRCDGIDGLILFLKNKSKELTK